MRIAKILLQLPIYVCIGGFKGGKGEHCPPPIVNFAYPMLADYTGIWEIIDEVLSCNLKKT